MLSTLVRHCPGQVVIMYDCLAFGVHGTKEAPLSNVWQNLCSMAQYVSAIRTGKPAHSRCQVKKLHTCG